MMKWVGKIPSIFPLFLMIGFSFAQDAVNPCEILSESLQCTGPGLHGAEIDFKTIKLNGKRKNDPMVSVGEAMVLSTKIKYTKRAKAEITTTFNGGCPDRTETKRLKPDVAVTYAATLDGNSYSGTGDEFTLNAPLAIGSYPLSVTFTATAVNGCIDNAPLSETKVFVLEVIDGAYILDVAAVKTGTATTVDSGAYLCKGQGQQLDLTVTFSDPLNTLPFTGNDIVWTVSPPSAGLFSGPTGANGQTVTWTQADDFVSATEDDLVITVNAPDMQPQSYYLTVFGINSTSGILTVNSTQTFPIEASDIAPLDANITTIVSALGGNTDVGFGTATKLRTRTFTGSSPFNQLENEAFLPSEADQTNPSLQIIKKATFMQVGSDLVVEIEAGPVVGDVNITWEQDRPGGTRQILHREHMTVTSGTPGQTVTLQEKVTTDAGPLFKQQGATIEIEAIVAPGTPPSGFPIWSVTPNFSGTVTKPADGDMDYDMSALPVGHYIIEAKLGPDPLQKDTMEVNITLADMDVDTDRNGLVEVADDATENAWSSSSGAIYIVNYDDDGGAGSGDPDAINFDDKGVPFGENYKIAHVNDQEDIAPLVINRVGSTSGLQFFLRVPNLDDLKAIHIFNGKIALSEVLKNSAGDYWSGWKAHHTHGRPNYLDITPYVLPHGDVTLGIEGLFFPGGKVWDAGYSFDGEVEIEFIIQKDTGTTTIDAANEISKDIVKLRVAPYMLLPNTQDALEIFHENTTAGNKIGMPFGSIQNPTPLGTTGNQWFQDHLQIGFTGIPIPGASATMKPSYVAMRLPYKGGQPDWPETDFLGPGQGVYRHRDFLAHSVGSSSSFNTGEFGGNLELIPKSPAWPLGRILVGDTMSTELQNFYKDQKAGGTTAVQEPITIDATWLNVGHVDEFVGFVKGGSKGYKVVHADPKLAYDLLKFGKYGISKPSSNAPLFAKGQHVSGQATNILTGNTLKFLFDGAAHGSIKVKDKSKFKEGKILKIKDGTNMVTFEFDDDGVVSGSNILIDITAIADETAMRNILYDAIQDQVMMGNLNLKLYKDTGDLIILINKAVTSAGNEDITSSVANSGVTLKGMDGGEDPGPTDLTDGRDFDSLMPGVTIQWVRLISGPGKGQVVKVEDSGPGWLKLDTMGSQFFNTTSKMVWKYGVTGTSLFFYIHSSTVMPRANTWFGGDPDDNTEYIAVEDSHTWVRWTSMTTHFLVPAVWSVKEYIDDMDNGTKYVKTLNDLITSRIETGLSAIHSGMWDSGGSGTTYLETDGPGGTFVDADDDHLNSDSDDDFISVPVIFIGMIAPTGSGDALVDRQAVAYTPGLANFQPANQNLIVFPKPFMPEGTGSSAGKDVFEAAVEHVLDNGTTPRVKFADDWDRFHRQDGEVHCGTNAKRIHFTMPWWGMLP